MSYESNSEIILPGAKAVPSQTPEAKNQLARGQFWLMWLGATAISAIVASVINHFVEGMVANSAMNPRAVIYFTGFVVGLLEGFAQGFVLRRFFPHIPFWIWPLATIIGIELGYVVYTNLPVAGTAFAGTLACFTGALIPLLVGPLVFITRKLGEKPAFGIALTIIIGILSFLLDKIISPAVEDSVASNSGLYFVVRTISADYVLAIFVGVAQWLALRTFMPNLKWWVWVLASVVGGSFAGLVRGVFFSVSISGFVGEMLVSTIASTLAAVATGYVLIQMLPSVKTETTEIMPERPSLG